MTLAPNILRLRKHNFFVLSFCDIDFCPLVEMLKVNFKDSPMSIVRPSVVNICLKHFLWNYWLYFDETSQE